MPETSTPSPGPAATPPLENGDRLTREEFERRYEAMPHLKKAELIEGVVCMPSPVRIRRHGTPHAHISRWAATYELHTPGVGIVDNGSVRLDAENEPQPDVFLFLDPACGGQARISDDDYLEGAPELVVEVSASSVSLDLHAKLRAYERNGVREYLVWRVEDRELDWFRLREGRFERVPAGEDGIHRSESFPGLWLDAAALTGGDLLRVHQVLAEGLASSEHAAFAERNRFRLAEQSQG